MVFYHFAEMLESKWKYNSFLFILNLFYVYLYEGNASETNVTDLVDDPDINRNVTELITSKGYPVEEHCIQTADGYLLSVQRIPHGENEIRDVDDKGVVLLIHGTLADSSIWVMNLPGQSLGFILSYEGYDVWLLNTRGCAYSRKHVKYTTKEEKFWDFSFDELAQYDVPDTIDYILNITQKKDLTIIAFSQGTTAIFAMLSDKPEYNDKVKLFIALAPVAFLGHTTSPARSVVPFADIITFAVKIMSSGEFFPTNNMKKFKEWFCGLGNPEFCENILFSLEGSDKSQINKDRMAVYLGHNPSSTSAKSLVHFAQLVKSKKFRKYDYGRQRNLKYYDQEEPPEYDLSRITTPVALFWSTHDKAADSTDVDILRKKLNSVVVNYCIPYPYSHVDFFIARNSPQMVNKPILKLLSKY